MPDPQPFIVATAGHVDHGKSALIKAVPRIIDSGPATVSELRQVLGSSRRVIVPLLEHLDRTFVTLRQGDKRTLR